MNTENGSIILFSIINTMPVNKCIIIFNTKIMGSPEMIYIYIAGGSTFDHENRVKPQCDLPRNLVCIKCYCI